MPTPSAIERRPAELLIERLASDCPPGAMFDALARGPEPVMLESSALHGEYGRYSVLACRPLEVLTLRDGELRSRDGRIIARGGEAMWRALGEAFACVELRPGPRPAYLPGWFGYIGYEVGRHVERLPGRARRDTALPDIRLALHDAVLIFDALERTWTLASLKFDRPPDGAGQAAEALRRIVRGATGTAEEHPAPVDHADAARLPALQRGKSNFTPRQYRRAVARCVEYIAAGDIFQVNLSQRLAIADAPPPAAIYRALRKRNPAWYAAYMGFESEGHACAVASSSPELFLRVRGRDVLTRPIKGTRPRVGHAASDAAAAAELLASAKDNAELAMIIDLLRNDLGRVCEYGSVAVAEPRRLETHPTVFHLVGTVRGILREGVGPAELLRATFPGGSITGAPKVRAMQIIDELEPTARGVYTGCIGTVGADGSCEWNIAIRTVVCEAGAAYCQVGGGIVADSSPQGEYDETLDKLRAMIEAIAQAEA